LTFYSNFTKIAEVFFPNETDQENVLKNPAMLKRLNDIEKMTEKKKSVVKIFLDAFIRLNSWHYRYQ
jgi:hypothetical protein